MDSLRIILLILGVIIIAAIYLWDRYQRRNNQYDYHTIPSSEDDDEPPLVITTGPKFDGDITSELANLNNIMSESSLTITHDELDVILSTDTSSQIVDQDESDNDSIEDQLNSESETIDASDAVQESDKDMSDQNGPIFVLHIVAGDHHLIEGKRLMEVIEKLGFEFGEMGIFHFYDNDNSMTRKSLFSLANMYKPGYFDLQNMTDFRTRGISVFARPSDEKNTEYVFESMLAVSKHVAELLGCVVLGPDRKPLTVDTIKQIQQQQIKSTP